MIWLFVLFIFGVTSARLPDFFMGSLGVFVSLLIAILTLVIIFISSLLQTKKSKLLRLRNGILLLTVFVIGTLIGSARTAERFLYSISGRTAAREKAVTLIRSGTLPSESYDGNELVKLPPEIQYLSDGDQVLLSPKGDIFFFDSAGFLDNYSGSVYSDHVESSVNERQFTEGPGSEIKKMNDHWYEVFNR